jgi:hypothetical protein
MFLSSNQDKANKKRTLAYIIISISVTAGQAASDSEALLREAKLPLHRSADRFQ